MAGACETTVPSPSPGTPTAGPTPFVLQSPFGTMRPLGTEPPETPRPTPPPPNAQYWIRVADMAEPRTDHAATLLLDGRVMVIGGTSIVRDPDGTGLDHLSLATTELFDPVSGTWTAGPPLRDARGRHQTALTLPDGRVLVGGGYQGRGSRGVEWLTSVEIFDPSTNRWSRAAEVPTRHGWETATLLRDGRVLVIGPVDRAQPDERYAASIFEPATASWQATALTDLVRQGHGAVRLGDGTVLVMGGSAPGAHTVAPLRRAAIYDPKADRWRDIGPMPVRVAWPVVALLPDGRALMEGEQGTELYDPSTRTWAETQISGDRDLVASVSLADGRVMALDDYPGIIHVYDWVTETWSELGPFKELTNVPFTLLADGRVLVAGGYLGCLDHNPCAKGEIAETWLFDPAGRG
jgi:hypothetical protein